MPEDQDVVLAKRLTRAEQVRREETLLGHLACVTEVFGQMFGTASRPTRLGERWLRYFGLDGVETRRFYVCALASCAVHDIGKANEDFQRLVRGQAGSQVLYHEHLSGLMLVLPSIWEWLSAADGIDVDMVVSSVIGHHLRVKHETIGCIHSPDRPQFKIMLTPIEQVLNAASAVLEVPLPGAIDTHEVWTTGNEPGRQSILDLRNQVRRRMRTLRRRIRRDGSTASLLRAVRAALIVADSAGSGLARERREPRAWLRDAFRASDQDLLRGDDIERMVICPRVAEVEGTTDRRFVWNDFQRAADRLLPRALLLAPCGSGKTLAAWRWIKAQTKREAVKRVLFLYPTRATASEGFRHHVAWAPEADAALIHGTAAYDLQGMFENPADERGHKDFTPDERLFAIGYWSRRIFSATVDQFLGFMQHAYGSTCLLPVLVDSVVVIDEVHSFGASLFSALKRFLKAFNVPVLCMTASLPRRRRADLEACGLHVFPEDPNEFEELQAWANMPRYAVRVVSGEAEAREEAEEARRGGKRVLWVVNTVTRCQRLARQLSADCYHSRFRLADRKRRHDRVIGSFDRSGRAAFAVTTQVCEMSLDLDADVLITESAPITSLIQRMGRCNRHARPGDGKVPGNVRIYGPADAYPYGESGFEGSDAFLAALDGKTVSQSRLQELLEEYGPSAVEPERYAAFLESGPWAVAREPRLRDTADFSVPAVLDADVDDYLDLARRRKPTDGLLLPAPMRLARRDARLGQFPQVVPRSLYDPEYGLFTSETEVTS